MYRYLAAATALGLLVAQPASADYAAGIAAYQRNDYGTAFKEFREAAQRGDADSQYMLGELYARGQGVNQDYVAAHQWYNLAAAQGRRGAADARDALTERMTSTQVERAQQAASSFRPTSASSGASQNLPEQYSVANVQAALNRLGYNAGPVDGAMGRKTRSAIREFQAANNLPVTGEASYELYQRLRGSVGGGSTATASSSSTATTEASPRLIADIQSRLRQSGYDIGAVSGNLDAETRSAIIDYQTRNRLAATGVPSENLLSHMRSSGGSDVQTRAELVRNVQQALNQRGYDAGPADGALGPKTRTAIRTFQSDAGLRVDGEVDQELLARLQSSSPDAGETTLGQIRRELRSRGYEVGTGDNLDQTTREAIRAYQRDADIAVTGEASSTLLSHLQNPAREEPNTNRGLVRQIQNELKERGFAIGPVDGVPGPATTQAIRTYQRNMNMQANGQPSVELLASLQQSERGAGQPSQASLVQEIEGELQSKGYRVGAVDGMLDSQTEEAIRRYQRDAGLNVDGDPDGELLAHLRGSNIRASLTPAEAAAGAANQVLKEIIQQGR